LMSSIFSNATALFMGILYQITKDFTYRNLQASGGNAAHQILFSLNESDMPGQRRGLGLFFASDSSSITPRHRLDKYNIQ